MDTLQSKKRREEMTPPSTIYLPSSSSRKNSFVKNNVFNLVNLSVKFKR
jgi:hypothetical protein